MRTRAVALLLSSAVAWHVLPAQGPTHTVTGVVFDSVVGVPLAGAVVQIALPDSTQRAFSAVTDATGHYRITGLPFGRFTIGFQHNALVALGLESPLSAFELGAGTTLIVDLAIPSGHVVRAQRCGKTSTDTSAGMLAGFVVDPRKGAAVGAAVTVRWFELVRIGGKFATTPQTVTTKVSDDGTYLACGVPADAWLNVRVAVTGDHVIDGHTSVAFGGATRLDFRLVDSGVVRGTAALMGRVLTLDRAPLASGRATIGALGIEVPIRDGKFSMTGLPSGTWDVEARAIGYEAHSVLVQLNDGAIDSTLITITRKVQALEAVSIIGKPGRDLRVLDDIVERFRGQHGTLFMPGNTWLASALVPSDVLRAATGFFTQMSADNLTARGCIVHGKKLVVYLDGFRIPDLKYLNRMLPINQVLAIEAYQDVATAPVQWRTLDACAIVAVWSKR